MVSQILPSLLGMLASKPRESHSFTTYDGVFGLVLKAYVALKVCHMGVSNHTLIQSSIHMANHQSINHPHPKANSRLVGGGHDQDIVVYPGLQLRPKLNLLIMLNSSPWYTLNSVV